MAGPNKPPRPGNGPNRPVGSGRARPKANRPPPAARPQRPAAGLGAGAPGAPSTAADEVLIDPAAPKNISGAKHLPMVPLSGRAEGTYDDGKDLGTGAFNRPQRDGGPRGPGPIAGPIASGPTPPMGIQGPVAHGGGPVPVGGPMMAGGPMMVGGPAPNPYAPREFDEPRSTSHRFFALVLVLVLMVCASIMGTGMIAVFAIIQANKPEELPPIEQVVIHKADDGPKVDTGVNVKPKSEPKPASRPTPRPRPNPQPSSSQPKSAPAPAAPAPPAPGALGTVSVTLPPGTRATWAEINCDGVTYRERAPFTNGKAVRNDVPNAPCEIILRGTGSLTKIPFQGPRSFVCSGVGSSLTCQ